jgi:hypothetical protein
MTSPAPTPAPDRLPGRSSGRRCQFCGYPAENVGPDWICPECGAGPKSRSLWRRWTGQRSRWVAIGAGLMAPFSLALALDLGWRIASDTSASVLGEFIAPESQDDAGTSIGTLVAWTFFATYAVGALLAFVNYITHVIDRRTLRFDRNRGLIACLVHATILTVFLLR